MDQELDLETCLSEEALYIESHSDFTFEDARSSLERAVRYYIDMGEDSASAWDHAVELVAMAVEASRRCGFDLRGTVDQMLFSNHHRVQSNCGF